MISLDGSLPLLHEKASAAPLRAAGTSAVYGSRSAGEHIHQPAAVLHDLVARDSPETDPDRLHIGNLSVLE